VAKQSDLETTLSFHLRATVGPVFEREYRFHPTRKWRFDFAFLGPKLAVEVDGGIWVGGRHNTGTGVENDCEKYTEAAILGWRIIRVTGKQIKTGYALNAVLRALKGA